MPLGMKLCRDLFKSGLAFKAFIQTKGPIVVASSCKLVIIQILPSLDVNEGETIVMSGLACFKWSCLPRLCKDVGALPNSEQSQKQ
jgi:hypothetical protein